MTDLFEFEQQIKSLENTAWNHIFIHCAGKPLMYDLINKVRQMRFTQADLTIGDAYNRENARRKPN